MKLMMFLLFASFFSTETATAKEKVNWHYTENTDVLRKQTEVRAVNMSVYRPDDRLHLAKVTVALAVTRKKDGKLAVAMSIVTPTKVVYCPKVCSIAARFDDGSVLALKAEKPRDYDYEIVFQNPNELIRQIRKSKELIVEVPIEKDLPEQHIFELSGLRSDL